MTLIQWVKHHESKEKENDSLNTESISNLSNTLYYSVHFPTCSITPDSMNQCEMIMTQGIFSVGHESNPFHMTTCTFMLWIITERGGKMVKNNKKKPTVAWLCNARLVHKSLSNRTEKTAVICAIMDALMSVDAWETGMLAAEHGLGGKWLCVAIMPPFSQQH